jgi:exosortase A-associated hydrolase 1
LNAHPPDIRPVSFVCEGALLQGLLHAGAPAATTGVLVIVGGPQYKVGSHRQFVLLGRALAERGYPVLRFDYRGLGDSEGEPHTFETIDADIRAAIDAFTRLLPGLQRVIVWGLCDAASAALFYGATDKRIAGLVLLNPWVRSQQTVAQAYLRTYYTRRIFDRQAWRELFRGNKKPLAVLHSFARLLGQATGRGPAKEPAGDPAAPSNGSLVERMRAGLAAFKGPVLLVLSGDDITAAEFVGATGTTAWSRLLEQPRVCRCELNAADHTFSTRAWRDQVATWTGDWLQRHWPHTKPS